jgi:hypothetical protein
VVLTSGVASVVAAGTSGVSVVVASYSKELVQLRNLGNKTRLRTVETGATSSLVTSSVTLGASAATGAGVVSTGADIMNSRLKEVDCSQRSRVSRSTKADSRKLT